MISTVLRIATSELSSALQPLFDKILISSIATTVALTTAQKTDVIPETSMILSSWVMTDYALAISMITGVLFGIEKIVTIYIKLKEQRDKNDS